MIRTPFTYYDQSYNNRRKAETTAKLQRVREMLAAGATVAQIAADVKLSIPTAHDYVRRVKKEAR